MSDRLNVWWQKWGPWVGPSAIVAVMSTAGQLSACSTTPWAIKQAVGQNMARIEALETQRTADAALLTEHIKAEEARAQLAASQATEQAVMKQSLTDMERRLERVETGVDLLVAAGMRKGEIPR